MALYEWSGSSWVLAPQNKIWNGSSWVEVKGAKVWNGSAWKEFLNCSITTGSSGFSQPGGKGTEYYNRSNYGYSGGDGDGAMGSYDGSVIGLAPYSFYWSWTVYEVSPTLYEFYVRLPGDTTGSNKAVLLDGSIITNAIPGVYNSGSTVYYWSSNAGDTVPTTNPFGAVNDVHNVQLV